MIECQPQYVGIHIIRSQGWRLSVSLARRREHPSFFLLETKFLRRLYDVLGGALIYFAAVPLDAET
jgi:hypothetical protein